MEYRSIKAERKKENDEINRKKEIEIKLKTRIHWSIKKWGKTERLARFEGDTHLSCRRPTDV